MKAIFRRWFRNGKNRIERRLNKSGDTITYEPQFAARNIHYEVSAKAGAITCGGIGAIHLLARRIGLIDAIDRHLHLLKMHLPYHESDHVLNFAYNALCHGACLQDIELRRNDENFLNALGTRRIPDPTTAGDFCRRFTDRDIETLLDVINDTRRRVWAEQPADFFACAIIDMDGTLAETTGQCKHGMDIAYNGVWGYHPLVVSLANTGEVLSIVNRPGNRPSHEGAAGEVDRSLLLCLQAGFRKVLVRGDTDFSQSEHLDRWDDVPRVRFIFGFDAVPNLEALAEDLPAKAWRGCTGRPATRCRHNRGSGRTTSRTGSSRNAGSRPCGCNRRRWPSSTTGRGLAARPTAWWWSARTSRGRKASRRCSMRSATSSTSPTNATPRPTTSCSRPTTAATRKTCSRS